MTIGKNNKSTVPCIDEEYQHYCNREKRRRRNTVLSITVFILIGGFAIGWQIAETLRIS